MLQITRLLITAILTSLSVLPSQTLAATQTVCATPNVLIPDNNIVGVSHALTITDPSSIYGLHLKGLTITHQHIGELTVTLKHGNTVVKVLDKPGMPANQYGCTGKNFSNLLFSDAASHLAETECTSTDPAYDNALAYQPKEPLSVFDGVSAAGEWVLTVTDNYDYNQTVGKLNQWCLEYSQPSQGVFFSQPAPGTPLIFTGAEYPTGSVYSIPVTEMSGKDSLLITNVFITQPGNATDDFSVTKPKVVPTPAAPLIIQPGQVYTFEAQCKPTDVGLRTATFEIHTNLPAPMNRLSYPLQCDGKAAWFESNTPPTLDFGKVAVGDTNSQTIQLSEAKGASKLKITRATLIGANKGDFHLDSSKLPITILQKGRAELPVTCQPTAGGLRTAKLVLTTNAPNALNFSYELKCLGDAAVAVFSPAESSQIAIEKVRVNKSKTYKIGVRNAKTATTALKLYDYQLISSQNAKLFKLISQPSLIEIGGSGNIDVACDAEGATPGNYSAKLRFATNDPTKLVIEYTFTCTIEQSKPLINLSPAKGSKISFDRVQKGGKNKIKTITLENSASASGELELSNPTFGGDGDAAFSIVSIPIKIGIGLKEEVQVQCNAEKTGSYTATLTLTTNDPEQPTLDYPVSCEVSNTVAPLYDSQPAPNDSAIIDLGNVVLGSSSTSPATTILMNEIGNDTLRVQLDTVALIGDANDFKVISPSFPLDIADDGAPVPLTVTCQPSAMGVRTATLNLVATDIHGKAVENFPHPQYKLQCTGYLPIYNSVNYPVKGDIDLGINSIGQSSKQNLTIKNTGNGDLLVDKDQVLLTGKETDSFRINELPVTIPAGKTKSLSIQCAPTIIGNLQAQLNLISNDPQLPQPQYTLKCTGQEAVGASYSSKPAPNSTITLDATLGSTATALLVVQEVGTAVLDVGQNSPVIDGEHAQDFSLDISESSPFAGGKTHFYIPDGTPERTVQITCKPTGEGQRKATLHLTSNDMAKPEISYNLVCNSGAVSAGYLSSPVLPDETIDCGTVQVGQVATRSFEIQETANSDLIVDLVAASTTSPLSGTHPADFKVLRPTFPIAIKDGSGERKTVTIQCQPTDVGTRTALLQLTTNDLSQKTVSYPLRVTGSDGLGSQLTLQTQGKGHGRITSTPEGVLCTATETTPSTAGQLPNACISPEMAANPIRCDAYFNRGTQVTLTPQPDPGSVFVGWNPECTNGMVKLEDDTTCIAEFADAPSADSDDLEMMFLEGNDLDFGTVNVGAAVSQTLTLKNKTAQALVLDELQVPTGLLLENTAKLTLSAGQTVNFPIHLDTTKPATVLGQLSFKVAGKLYQFAARAKVVAADNAQLTVSYPNAEELDFGTLSVGESVTREVVIKNNALQPATLSHFVLPAEITGNLATTVTLEAQQSLSLQLTLKPMVEGLYTTTWSFTVQQKIYNLRARAKVKTAQLANGCYVATRLYVNSAATGQATGLNWADALVELQSALTYANQCDTVQEIWVAKGRYKPTSTTDRKATFKLRKNLALYGGFNGSETLVSERNLTDNVTILSGDIGQPNVFTDNSYHVVTTNATDATSRLDGFSVTAGQADAESDDCGGGMLNDNGSPKVMNVTFSHNYAKQGAGMCNKNGSHPKVNDVIFTENQAVDGAGMANLAQSNPVMARVSFTANQATRQAGALYNDRSSPILSHSVLQDNHADEGGAIVNIVSQPFYSHLIINGNVATHAAVMLNRQSEPRLSHVTVSGNAATTDSGIVNIDSRPVIQNSILWDNHAVTAKKLEEPINDDANSRTVISNSIVQSVTLGKGTNKNKNPLFIKPVDFTAASLSNGDLHLQATSPAIDMGNNDNIPNDLADIDLPEGDGVTDQKVTLDIDYQPRISDGNGDGKLEVDAGAYEYSAAPATKYSLTVNKLGSGDGSITSSIAGIKCGATCVANYLAKTRLTLQVKPVNGAIFTGWTGDCQGSATTLVVELIDNKQCTAHFEQDAESDKDKDKVARCETSGGVARGCDAQGKTLTDITIYGDGNVQNAAISGQVSNQGWLTNATIKPQAKVSGGKLTGSVLNKGELQDVEFYGALLSGGTLSGTITNKSPKGVIRDVQLAPAATLKGGRLAGKIVGDATAPARVSNVIIAAGSSLQNIVLDGIIVIEQDAASPEPVTLDVQLAPNTQIVGGKIAGKLVGDASAPARLSKTQVKAGTKLQHVRLDTRNTLLASEKCQRETLAADAQSNAPELADLHAANEAETVLSDLQDNAIGINNKGQPLAKVATLFTARIITDTGEQANKTVLSSAEAKSLKLAMTIRLDAKHANKAGEVLVAVVHTDEKGQVSRYMKTAQGWAVWNGQVENLQSAQSFKQLPEQVDLSVFAGDLSGGAGQFEVYTGYRLKDGTVVYNGKQAMQFSVLPKLAACNWACACAQ